MRQILVDPYHHPRWCMWACRLVPMFFLGSVLTLWLTMLDDVIEHTGNLWEIPAALFLVSVIPYVIIVIVLLPRLLFVRKRSTLQTLLYYLMAIITGGAAPVFWYYLRVDATLRNLTLAKRSRRRTLNTPLDC
jgi:hypothetical protein